MEDLVCCVCLEAREGTRRVCDCCEMCDPCVRKCVLLLPSYSSLSCPICRKEMTGVRVETYTRRIRVNLLLFLLLPNPFNPILPTLLVFVEASRLPILFYSILFFLLSVPVCLFAAMRYTDMDATFDKTCVVLHLSRKSVVTRNNFF